MTVLELINELLHLPPDGKVYVEIGEFNGECSTVEPDAWQDGSTSVTLEANDWY